MPARKMKIGAQKCVIQRVRNSAGSATSRGLKPLGAEEIAGVVERHHHHDQAAQQVDGVEPRACSAGGGGVDVLDGADGKRQKPRIGLGQAHNILFFLCRPQPTTGRFSSGKPRDRLGEKPCPVWRFSEDFPWFRRCRDRAAAAESLKSARTVATFNRRQNPSRATHHDSLMSYPDRRKPLDTVRRWEQLGLVGSQCKEPL